VEKLSDNEGLIILLFESLGAYASEEALSNSFSKKDLLMLYF
jgi:hypothetical protein